VRPSFAFGPIGALDALDALDSLDSVDNSLHLALSCGASAQAGHNFTFAPLASVQPREKEKKRQTEREKCFAWAANWAAFQFEWPPCRRISAGQKQAPADCLLRLVGCRRL